MAHYNLKNILKFKISNSIIIDVFPEVQSNIVQYLQCSCDQPESGGLLIGYENSETMNLTVSNTTIPNSSDISTRCSLKLSEKHANKVRAVELPYGYIGTWHTHPTRVPSPSSIDLNDWNECVDFNKNKTNNLIFIICGTSEFRLWVANCKMGIIEEGILING